VKYAVEIGSHAMIYSYIASFVEIGSGIQKLIRRDTNVGTQPHREHGELMSILLFFK
jgi:hypothetical protein